MNADVVSRVRENPKFAELIRKRTKYSWSLAIIMFAIYYGFIFLVAFGKALLASRSARSDLAFPIGIGVISPPSSSPAFTCCAPTASTTG